MDTIISSSRVCGWQNDRFLLLKKVKIGYFYSIHVAQPKEEKTLHQRKNPKELERIQTSLVKSNVK